MMYVISSVVPLLRQAVIGAILEDRLPPQVAGLDRGLRRAWKVRKCIDCGFQTYG